MKKLFWLFCGGIVGLFVVGAGLGIVYASPAQYGMPGKYDATPVTLTDKSGTALAVDNLGRVLLSTSTSITVGSAGTASNPIANGYFLNLNSVTSTITALASSTSVVAGSITDTALTQNQILYAGVGGLLSGSSNLIWNNGTGAMTVTGTFRVNGSTNINGSLTMTDTLGNSLIIYRMVQTPPGSARNITVTGISSTDINNYSNLLIQGSGGAVTITATPNIPTGANGQKLCLLGNSDANTITIQDDDVLASSGVKNQGNVNITLGSGDQVCYQYWTAKASWIMQTPYMDN